MSAAITRWLGRLDTTLHHGLDWYINRQWLGWGLLQLAEWHVCQAYERRVWEGFE